MVDTESAHITGIDAGEDYRLLQHSFSQASSRSAFLSKPYELTVSTVYKHNPKAVASAVLIRPSFVAIITG